MKTSNVFLVLLAILTVTFSSCDKNDSCISGQGGDVTRIINVASFNQIDLAEAANVTIRQGQTQEIRVTAPSNIIDLLDKTVSGERWDIDFGNDCAKDYRMSIDITIPNLDNIILSGTGNITVANFVGANTLGLTISGSGDISLNRFNGINGVKSLISGSGNIYVNQLTAGISNVETVISGSGNYYGFGFITSNCDVLISGSGNVETYADDVLTIKISGSGNVFYKGYPAINSDISGSGNVINSN